MTNPINVVKLQVTFGQFFEGKMDKSLNIMK